MLLFLITKATIILLICILFPVIIISMLIYSVYCIYYITILKPYSKTLMIMENEDNYIAD
jgi:hypothetical protein